ncbi:carboxypeptidase-like regulatory domain-containing protein [Bradyrhizobium sp. SSUT112]|uniref:carboxypeptidase-like regulatory domain-containing protein n=1 Tax=Bradyrhizobium sp. SSUT112 TaxID=3040604 RepID=UPI00244A1661|nr:carboxypeptidase-like regulatory domain-containing protein [Bradyrhizobium sp. SSUT112]MDH2352295.1 carboxypeptidase-like regulatory domain-containing protein [Bradyrhizobium sp. SSUT112]
MLASVALLSVASLAWSEPLRPVDNKPDAPLQGPEGVTSLSGQIVDLDGRGLPGVELSAVGAKTTSDASGRFLLTFVQPGAGVLHIDGRRGGAKRDADYGYYQARVEAKAGQTTVLPYKNWLPLIDHSHDVTLTVPTRSEVVVRAPGIPDLELRIDAGVVVRDVDGREVRRVGITAVPADRTPVPLPASANIPTFFVIQPGAACLYDAKGGIGTARLVFPNFDKELPKARATLWRYEPDGNGWAPYGQGTVSSDGRQIIPDAGVVLTDFSSAECDPATRTRQPPPSRITQEQIRMQKQTRTKQQ